MLELAFPWALAALPLPLLAWRLLPPYRRRSSALRVPFFDDIVRAAGAQARAGAVILRRRRLQMISAALSWCLLVLGLARPEWVGEPIVRTEAARDVMLAVDLSGSMDTADFPGEDGRDVRRMDAVRRVVDRFVAARDSDRIGLIVFGNRAYMQLPFTRDLATARSLVALMDVGMAGPQTAIGDAIGLAIHAFASSELSERLLILLTDGSGLLFELLVEAEVVGRDRVVAILARHVDELHLRRIVLLRQRVDLQLGLDTVGRLLDAAADIAAHHVPDAIGV